jgi:hypothetical protein
MQFWPLNDQITVSFVRAAGVLSKGRMRPAGRMFDMPDVDHSNTVYSSTSLVA